MSSKFTSLCLVFVLFYLTAFVVSAASEEQTEPEERTEPIGPEASFAADVVSGNAPLKVTFTAIGTGGIPASWHWDFGDGTNSENAQTITHTYANPGTYPVTLTVTNEAGSDTASDVYIMVYEVPVKPTAAFTAAVTTGEAPLTVEFVDTSTGGVTSRYWDFEDGTNSAASKTVIHTFNNPGTYTVTLTVTNDVGSDSLSKSDYITVSTASEPEVPAEPEPLRPEAAFTANTVSGDAPLKVTFTDTGTGGIPTSWYWDFGDGITSKHAQTATHTFTNSGIYTVTLTVTNEAGSDTASRTDYIKVHEAPAKPKAAFTADIKSGKVPLAVKFTDTSAGEVTSRDWDFGDGTNSAGTKAITHTFTKPGAYTVTLMVTNDAGSDSISEIDYITASAASEAPIASFYSPQVEEAIDCGKPLSVATIVSFIDSSTGSPSSWLWNFGDGETSTAKNPTHMYVEPGCYTVKLTVTNEVGSNTVSKDGYVLTASEEQSAYIPTDDSQLTQTEISQSTTTNDPETFSPSVSLHSEKTEVVCGEDVLFRLSAVNLITKPQMHVQVIIIPPSGMSVSSTEFVESGAGQYTATFDLDPGKGKDIEVRIAANQVGNFDVRGRAIYYFGNDKIHAEDQPLNLPITVADSKQHPTSMLESYPIPGFELVSLISVLITVFALKRNKKR